MKMWLSCSSWTACRNQRHIIVFLHYSRRPPAAVRCLSDHIFKCFPILVQIHFYTPLCVQRRDIAVERLPCDRPFFGRYRHHVQGTYWGEQEEEAEERRPERDQRRTGDAGRKLGGNAERQGLQCLPVLLSINSMEVLLPYFYPLSASMVPKSIPVS